MNIHNHQIPKLLEAHRKLDGLKFSKEQEKTHYAIVRNLRHLETSVEDLRKTQNRVMAEISEGKTFLQQGTPEFFEFNQRVDALMQEEQEIALFSLDYNALDPIHNNIGPGTILALEPVLKNMPDLGAPDL